MRFSHVWPEDEDPAWHRDVLLADRIVAPVLAEHREWITLWHVHRRAGPDSARHQFSFIFRTTPEVAARINARIESDPLLTRLLRDYKIKTVCYDDPAKPQRPAIKDTSDPSWTPEMQRAWPHYIMGVSRFWLELIHELAASADKSADLDTRYAAISDELDNLWLHQLGHALLHPFLLNHLNTPPMPTLWEPFETLKQFGFWDFQKKQNFIKPLLRIFMVWCRKFPSLKRLPFTPVPPMHSPSFMLTGLRSTTGRHTIYLQLEDFVIATGQQHSIREFVELAARELDMDIHWKGTGTNDTGIDKKTGNCIVEVDPMYFRSTEVDSLMGNSAKAMKRLGWKPKISFEEMVREMVQEDVAMAQRDDLCKRKGFKVLKGYE